MSVLRVVLLLLLNLALYAFLAARLLGWRPPGWRAEDMRQRVLSVGLAVALTVAVLLGSMTLLTSGLVSESGSLRILRSALWVDGAIILLLLVLWGLPRLPWLGLRSEGARQRVLALVLAVALTAGVAVTAVALLGSGSFHPRLLRSALWLDSILILFLLALWGLPRSAWQVFLSESMLQRAFSVALALALTAAAALGGIALVASGLISGAGSLRMLRIALLVDAGMALLLLVLWIFPRLPWPVYGQMPVRAPAEWRQALGGLTAAVLIVATIAGGFILAYGEIGALDNPDAVETAVLEAPTLVVVAYADTHIPPTPSSSSTELAKTAMAMALPTRSGTEIPTVTPTAGSAAALTQTNLPTPTATATSRLMATAQPTSPATSTPLPVSTATSLPTVTLLPTVTAIVTATACVPSVVDWVEHTVQHGDTLSGLAQQAGTQSGAVLQANCLTDDQLDVGQHIFLPHIEVVTDGVLLARQRADPPVVDGDLSEWRPLANTADVVVYGAGNWSDASDLSATFSLGWDTANLYLAVSVQDDVLVQTQNGEMIFRGDSVEFLLDSALEADRQLQKLSGDDYQIGLSPGDLTAATVAAQAYLWFPDEQTGSLSAVQVAASTTVDGYVLEAAMPWAVLGVSPAPGQEYGFTLSVSDNDLSGGVAMQQSMVSSAAGRALTDPTTWGLLRLDP